MNLITCKLDAIRLDGGTQPRTGINEAVVAEYAEAIMRGDTLPPPVCFWDGANRWLVDGYHRVHAHRQAGSVEIEVEQRNGTLREAVLYSVGANATHGLRLSHDDKRKAVRLLLEDAEWGQWTDRRIAEATNTSHTFVSKVRASLTPASGNVATSEASGNAARSEPEVRKFERNGKEHEQRIKARPDTSVATPRQQPTSGPVTTPEDEGPDMGQLLDEMQADLRRAEARVAELEKALTDGGKEHVANLAQRLDHAERRRDEAMEEARLWKGKAEREERTLAKLGRMVGERDLDKAPAAIEQFIRRARVAA